MELTKRQLRVLKFIRDFCMKRGYAPTIREITAGLDYGSTNSPRQFLTRFRERGLVVSAPGLARTLRLTAAGHEAVRHG